jgi:response regulator RpfG family c-di-GMP phosphodiesterase
MIILFSFHATLLLVIPTLISVQYKNDKFLSIITIVISLILVILTTYGSFLFGEYDANLLKPLTKAEAENFQARLDLFLSVRSFEILYHHILTKLLCVLMIDVISIMISRRYDDMISLQIKLSDEVQKENVSKVKMQNAVIEHLADIIESRDIETGEHIKRTKIYVSILVNKMKDMDKYKNILTPKLQEDIINSAPLHDIGKIAVSDLILCKPGKLTDEEYDKMKIHTVKGGEIIKKILAEFDDKSFLNTAYDVAISHHEKWNGLGYPYGIKGEEIPLAGRIMAVADVFDALVAKRVYKQPMPIDKAVSIIIGDAGTHFDPDIIEVFKEVVDDFKKVALDE